jgi:hypothetical protein
MSTRGTTIFGVEELAARTNTLALATTLTASDSGNVFTLSAATGKAITLPSVAVDGFKAKFVVGAVFATTNFTIVAPTSKIQGGAIVNSVFVPASNENTISFVASAETIGDYINIVSDGTNYYVEGAGALAGSITFTAV